MKETVDEKSKQMEIKTLKPFFMEDLNGFRCLDLSEWLNEIRSMQKVKYAKVP